MNLLTIIFTLGFCLVCASAEYQTSPRNELENVDRRGVDDILQLLLDKRTRTASRGRARARWGGSRGGRWHGRRRINDESNREVDQATRRGLAADAAEVARREGVVEKLIRRGGANEEVVQRGGASEVARRAGAAEEARRGGAGEEVAREENGALANEFHVGLAYDDDGFDGGDAAWRNDYFNVGSGDEEEAWGDGEEEEEERDEERDVERDVERGVKLDEKQRGICPPLTRSTRSRKAPGSAVNIKVVNWSDVPAQLILIDSDGSHRNMGNPLEPGRSNMITTRPGRAYVAYSADSAAYRMFLNYKCIWFVGQGDNFAAITE